MGDRNVGLQARLMSQAMRKLTGTISRTNTVCIFINQLREKIGVMFGPSETTTGGNALKFYASVRIDIRPGQSIKDGEDVFGKRAKVKVVKNKVAPPFKRCEFDLMFGEGISRSGEILDLGVDNGIIKKSGSWFSYNDQKLAQGRDAAKAVIADNPELADELEARIMEALRGSDHPVTTSSDSDEESTAAEAAQPAPEKAAKSRAAKGDGQETLDFDADFDDDLDDDFTLDENI